MKSFLVRFTAGGLLVATVPLVSKHVSPRLAGIIVLLPIVTLSGFFFIGREQGMSVLAKASGTAAMAVPAVLAFLITVHFTAQRNTSLAVALFAGMASWFAVAVPLSVLVQSR